MVARRLGSGASTRQRPRRTTPECAAPDAIQNRHGAGIAVSAVVGRDQRAKPLPVLRNLEARCG